MRYLFKYYIIIICLTLFMNCNQLQSELCPNTWERPDHIIEYECSLTKDDRPQFMMKYKEMRWLEITCVDDAPLSTLRLKSDTKIIIIVSSISFKGCEFPNSEAIHEIMQIPDFELILYNLTYQSFTNATVQLRREDFINFKYITNLVLTNNNLTEVPVDLLYDLVDLRHLNISWNLLEDLPAGFFNLKTLEFIDISHNRLKILQYGSLSELQYLVGLNLESNQLSELTPPIFDNLTSLMHLNVAQNNLQYLSVKIFAKLQKLKYIDLSKNNFTEEGIPMSLFRYNHYLESVSFAYNKKQLRRAPHVTDGASSTIMLVNLDGNGLVEVTKDRFFITLTSLKNLSLAWNNLTEIPDDFFKYSEELRFLSLHHNNLTTLSLILFTFLPKLEILDVSHNQLKEFNNKILDHLGSLKELNLANNQIERIREEGYCPFLNHNYADHSISVTNDREISFCPKNFEKVYLSHNKLETVPNRWLRPDKLKILMLDNNRIKKIMVDDFIFYTSDTVINYDSNQIEAISFAGFENILKNRSLRVKLSLLDNPINCDCKIHDFLRYRDRQFDEFKGFPFISEIEKLNCSEPKELSSTKIADVDERDLKCLVVDPSGLNTNCPTKCQCWSKPYRVYLIDCSYRNLTQAPALLQGLEGYHIELNLTGNLIKSIPSMLQSGYENLTKLLLSNNIISSLNAESLSDNLQVLILDSNRLEYLEADVLHFLEKSTKLKRLTLYNNPWVCNCDAVNFLKFISATIGKNPDYKLVTCATSDYPIFQMTQENMCPMPISSIIIIVITIAILGILISSTVATYYCYRQEIKVWLYAKQWCLWLVTEDELDKDKEYDAFISFSHMDEDFVANTLISTLEEGPQAFRLCVHYRDWIPGEPIPTQIVHSVENSRRTIVVLSPSFLESIWSRIEFRTAHQQALSEGRARVIVILLGEIEQMDHLDSEIRAYLTTNTYVKWGDPWFWEKLTYALPHSPKRSKKFKIVNLYDDKNQSLTNERTANIILNTDSSLCTL